MDSWQRAGAKGVAELDGQRVEIVEAHSQRNVNLWLVRQLKLSLGVLDGDLPRSGGAQDEIIRPVCDEVPSAW